MRKLGIALLTGCTISSPAILFLAMVVMPSRGQYYFPGHAVMGLVFLGGSFLAGMFIPLLFYRRVSTKLIILFLFSGTVIAWILSLMVLVLLDLTPLCVGQDNGDGNNDVMLCIYQDGLFSVVYTPVAVFFIGLASITVGWFISRYGKIRTVLTRN